MTEDAAVGSPETKLLVIRGNSGSGKSSVARQVRYRYGRGMALEQDYLRRNPDRVIDARRTRHGSRELSGQE